jgi:hypothetical protein
MLTIENYHKLKNKHFIAKSGTPGWIVADIEEYPSEYQIAVMPMKGKAYSIADAIVYHLSRFSPTGYDERYIMINHKTLKSCSVMKSNLTLHNFILELGIQTNLYINQC